MKYLLKCISGSRSYGLATPTSDVDERGIILNTEASKILGLEKFNFIDKRENGEDSFYSEFRHYLETLQKSNSQSIELLYCPANCILEKTDEWDLVLKY